MSIKKQEIDVGITLWKEKVKELEKEIAALKPMVDSYEIADYRAAIAEKRVKELEKEITKVRETSKKLVEKLNDNVAHCEKKLNERDLEIGKLKKENEKFQAEFRDDRDVLALQGDIQRLKNELSIALESNKNLEHDITEILANNSSDEKFEKVITIFSRLDGLLSAAGQRDRYASWKDDVQFQAIELVRDVIKNQDGCDQR